MRIRSACYLGVSAFAFVLAGCMGGGDGGDLNISPTSAAGAATTNTNSGTTSSSSTTTTTTTTTSTTTNQTTSSGTQAGGGSNTYTPNSSGTPSSSGSASGSPTSLSGSIATPGGRAGLATYSMTATDKVGRNLNVRKVGHGFTDKVQAYQFSSQQTKGLYVKVNGLEKRFYNCQPNVAYCSKNITPTYPNYRGEGNLAYYEKYTYGTLGSWYHWDNYGVKLQGIQHLFIDGHKSVSIPRRGRAYYAGTAMYNLHEPLSPALPGAVIPIYRGRFRMAADFSTGKINGALDQFRILGTKNEKVNRTFLGFNGNIRGNVITYKVNGGIDVNGRLISAKAVGRGYFYGPNAKEVGGAFVIRDNNDKAYANAVFYGKR